MSTEPMAALHAAIAAAIADSSSVGKDAKNTFQGYKYASAEALIEEARTHLAAHGLACVPTRWSVVALDGGPVSGGGKASMYFADVEVTYLITHSSGASLSCETTTPAVTDNGRPQDKAVATALTYSLGYFLRGLLLLPRVDEEHDVDRRDDRRDDKRAKTERAAPPPAASTPADIAGMLAAIDKTDGTTALKVVGAVIAGADVAKDARATLSAAYKAKMNAHWQREKQAAESAASEAAQAARDEEPAK